MKLHTGKAIVVGLAAVIALTSHADARRRGLPGPLGVILGGPMAVIGGVAHALSPHKAWHRRAAQARRSRVIAAGAAAGGAAAVTSGQAQPSAESRAFNTAWNGPLFWPYATDGVFDYAFGMPGDDSKFWSHGFDDVIEAMFVPTPRAATDGSAPSRRSARQAATAPNRPMPPAWQALCGSETPNAAGALADRIRQNVEPTEAQRAAFDELQAAFVRAGDRIKSACPAEQALTPTARLNLMIARLSAIRQAVLTVGAPLTNFYNLLDDRQKAAFDSAVGNGSAGSDTSPAASACAQSVDWPSERITRTIRPTPAQYEGLERLRMTSLHLAQFVASTCPKERPRTVLERLEAAKMRLNALRYGALNIAPAFNRFYLSLSDEQKARLNGPARDLRAEFRR